MRLKARVVGAADAGAWTETILNRATPAVWIRQRAEVHAIGLPNGSKERELDPASALRARLGIVTRAHPVYPRPSALALARAQEEFSRGKPLSVYVSEGRR